MTETPEGEDGGGGAEGGEEEGEEGAYFVAGGRNVLARYCAGEIERGLEGNRDGNGEK